jgi:choline-sulfatase
LGAGAATLAGAALQAGKPERKPPHPNVLWILTDQHRADVAGYAGDAQAHTPALDRLARQSVEVSDMYCQVPLCLPARHSILTGQYAHTHGAFTNMFPFVRPVRTIAHALSDAGYSTALFGKTHCDTSGFGTVRSFHDQLADFKAAHPDGRRPGDDHYDLRRTEGSFEYLQSMNPGQKGPGDGPVFYMEEAVVRDSVRFMRESRGEAPFFLWASFLSPHPPLFAPPEFSDLFADADLPLRGSMEPEGADLFDIYVERRVRQELEKVTPEMLRGITRSYYASLAWVDHCIGRLLQQLEVLGLAEDTLVIYTSDHGELLGEHALLQKRAFFEGACRVPCLLRWPGRLMSGVSRRNVAEHLDLVATLFQLAGVRKPRGFSGRSMVDLLNGKDPEWEDRALIESPGESLERSVRWALRRGNLKYMHVSDTERALFDVEADPGEKQNLIDSESHAGEVDALRDLFVAIGDGTEWVLPRPR